MPCLRIGEPTPGTWRRPVATGTRVGCPGTPRAAATRPHTDSRLFAGSVGAGGTRRPHRAGPIASRAGPGGANARAAANRYLTEQVLPQHNKRVRGGRRSRAPPASRGSAVPRRRPGCARRAHRGHGPYGAGSGHDPANPARLAPVPSCDGPSARARISRWDLGRIPWAPVLGAQPRGWPANRDGRSPPGPDLQVEPPTDRRSEGPGAQPTVGARLKDSTRRTRQSLGSLHRPT